ncbi:hypothetical protein E2C01_075653 [Portunus trituberculatus]|uniref:Uncharacterized protein n=1 Tax=Portunus trituberculatus TaxID=210409 RepID=A0A5B7IFI9_PORTR|nr:hypothetical protein [Portunus trituberculatus]
MKKAWKKEKAKYLNGTCDLKAHPLGNRCPERGSPTYTQTVNRIRTRALGDPSEPKARMGPLYL